MKHRSFAVTGAATCLAGAMTCIASAGTTLRVSLTESPGTIEVGDAAVLIEKAADAIAATEPPQAAIALSLGKGGAWPARSLVPLVDRLLRARLPVRIQVVKGRTRAKVDTDTIALQSWLEDAPSVADVCVGGELPSSGAARGLAPLLAVDLRGFAALVGDERTATLRSSPRRVLEAAVPGDAGPSATLALAVGEGPTMHDLFRVLSDLGAKGWGRVLLLLKDDGAEYVKASGFLVSLAEASDQPHPLEQRRSPPSRKSAPAFRAIRVLAEEAVLAMRLALRADGSMRSDDVFTEAESTALALVAFLDLGVRAGDGTPTGNALLLMERWLLAWPEDSRRRYPRRERTVVSWAKIEAYWRTRHPLLRAGADEALAEIRKEIETDAEFRDGIEKGFEAIAVVRAEQMGLDVGELPAKLKGLIESALDDEGRIVATYSTLSSTDYVALANALVLLGTPATNARVLFMAAQAGNELPSTDSALANEQRALSAFFQSRFSIEAGGEAATNFTEMLKRSLPKSAPTTGPDVDALDPDDVKCPWSGGGRIESVARVALMTIAYAMPDRNVLDAGGGKRGR